MREILHIFRKDTRRLRYEIAVVLALVALFAWTEPRTSSAWDENTRRINVLSGMLKLLLPLAWWYLIVAVIHQEALAGDRQYWLTRPIRWPLRSRPACRARP